MKLVLAAFGLVSVLFLGACGASDGAGHDHDHSAGAGHAESEGEVPGEPASRDEATRTLRVVAGDDLRFDPEEVEVEVGEAITFVVVNEGATHHEFVLGDEEYQAAHATEMAGRDMQMAHGENAVMAAPGEKASVTWRFTEPGRVLYGCHVDGHYAGGMVGEITVR